MTLRVSPGIRDAYELQLPKGIAMTDLSKVGARNALKPKSDRTPWWERLRPGLFLGYRPAADAAAGTWAVRVALPGKPSRQFKLESFGGLKDNQRYAKAAAAAEEIMQREESGGSSSSLRMTVADACREYAKKKPAAERFFEKSIYTDEIATVKLEDLRRSTLVAWRERLEGRDTQYVRRGGNGKLSKSSVNREMAPVRAAIYAKMAAGQPSTDAAWQEALKKYDFVDTHNPRKEDLDIDQRKALIANILPAPEHQAVKLFVRALCVTAMRPGILAKLNVEHFNKRTCVLTVPHRWDKGRKGREINWSGSPAAELFAEQCKGKLPGAPLFMQADGKRWDAEAWKVPIRAAAEAAGLPVEVCAYTIRHSAISDLVQSGIDLFTVATYAGTSVKEIEDTYGKLRPNTAQQALKALAV